MCAQKQLCILAGGNEAGKSTFYKTSMLSGQEVHFVNVDLVAKGIDPGNPEIVSYEAAHLVERIRDEFVLILLGWWTICAEFNTPLVSVFS